MNRVVIRNGKDEFDGGPPVGDRPSSVLEKTFPKLLAHARDDETAIVYWPKFRQFGVPILDGGSSILTITHDPWSGAALPPPLRDEWFYAQGLDGFPNDPKWKPAPEFQDENWWVERGL